MTLRTRQHNEHDPRTGSALPESPVRCVPVPRPGGLHLRRRRCCCRHRRRHCSGHRDGFFWFGGHVVRRSPRLTTRLAYSRPAESPGCRCWTRSLRPRRTTCGREQWEQADGGGGCGSVVVAAAFAVALVMVVVGDLLDRQGRFVEG